MGKPWKKKRGNLEIKTVEGKHDRQTEKKRSTDTDTGEEKHRHI